MMKHTKKKSRVEVPPFVAFLGVFVVFGLTFFFVFMIPVIQRAFFFATAEKAVAVVQSTETRQESNGDSVYFATITYQANGQEYSVIVDTEEQTQPLDKIDVVYSPRNPKEVKSYYESPLVLLIIAFIPLIFVLVGVVGIIKVVKVIPAEEEKEK